MINAIKKIIDLKIIIIVAMIVFFIPISIDSAQYLSGVAIGDLPINIWIVFALSLISLAIAIFLIIYKFKVYNMFGKIALCLCSLIIISNVITTFLEPSTIISHIYSFRLTYYVDVSTNIDFAAKWMFVLQFSLIVFFFFIALFVAPSFVRSIDFIKYAALAILILFALTIVYSLIFETSKYMAFLSSIFNCEASPQVLSNNSLNSFFLHKNIYALFISFVLISELYLFTVTRRKAFIVVSVFTLLYIVLTYSKSLIILTWLFSIIFFYLFNALTFKENKKNKLIIMLVVSALLVITFVLFLTIYSINSSFKNMIDSLYLGFGTYSTRTLLWKNVMQIVTPEWIYFGRGFGITETILPKVTLISFEESLPHEHSWFYSMLAKGGILLLVVFIVALLYISFLSYKSFRHNMLLSLPFIMGELMLFIQSFIENNYYSIFGIAFFVILIGNFKNIEDRKEELNNESIC